MGAIGLDPDLAAPTARPRPILEEVDDSPQQGLAFPSSEERARWQPEPVPAPAPDVNPETTFTGRGGETPASSTWRESFRGGSTGDSEPDDSPEGSARSARTIGSAADAGDGDVVRGSAGEESLTVPSGPRGVLRLKRDHLWDAETVYREASLVWGLE